MHASGAADACTGSGVSWAVACASAAGVRAAPAGSVAQSAEPRKSGRPTCRSCSVQVGERYGEACNKLVIKTVC